MVQTYNVWMHEFETFVHAQRYEDPVAAEKLNDQAEVLRVLIGRINRDSEEVIRLCQELKVPDCRLAALNKLYNVSMTNKTPLPNPNYTFRESDNEEPTSGADERPLSVPPLSVAQLKSNAKRARNENDDVDNATPAEGNTKRIKIDTMPTLPSDCGLDDEGRASRRSWAVNFIGRRGNKKVRDQCERAHTWLVDHKLDEQCRLCYWWDTENECLRTPCCGRCVCTDCVFSLAKAYSNHKKTIRKGAYAMPCPSCREPFSERNYDAKKPYLPAPGTADDSVLRCLVHYWSGITEGRLIRREIAEWRVSVAEYGILPEMDMLRFKHAAVNSERIRKKTASSADDAVVVTVNSDYDDENEEVRPSDKVDANIAGPSTAGHTLLDLIGVSGLSVIDQLSIAETLQKLHELNAAN